MTDKEKLDEVTEKLFAYYDAIERNAEIIGHYVPEVVLNIVLAPKDGTLHHLIHSLQDFKEELEESIKET